MYNMYSMYMSMYVYDTFRSTFHADTIHPKYPPHTPQSIACPCHTFAAIERSHHPRHKSPAPSRSMRRVLVPWRISMQQPGLSADSTRSETPPSPCPSVFERARGDRDLETHWVSMLRNEYVHRYGLWFGGSNYQY